MARKLTQIISAFLTTLAVSAWSVSTLADTVIVDSKATGGFGLHPDEAPPAGGTPMVLGFVFGGPSTVVIIANGTVDLFPGLGGVLENIPPDGRDFFGDDFALTRAANLGYVPLEEASVDGGADFTTFSNTIPDTGVLIGAFAPQSTVDSPGFLPEDEDFGVPGIGSDQLFIIGSGPFEFKANEPGTLFLGINDNRPSNNTGSFEVTLSENVSIADDVTLGSGHTLGEGTVIRSGTTIGDDADVSEDVTIQKDVQAGDGFEVGQDTVVKQDVVFGDDVMIGENVVIGRDCHIGNNVEIGNDTTIRRDCLIGDDVIIGERVTIGSDVEVLPTVNIADDEVIPKNSIVSP